MNIGQRVQVKNGVLSENGEQGEIISIASDRLVMVRLDRDGIEWPFDASELEPVAQAA